jgi:hypothetical protein
VVQLVFLSTIGRRNRTHFWPCAQRRPAMTLAKMSWQGARFRSGSARRLLLTVLHTLASGLLSGLDKQGEITELLEQLYYDSLDQAPRSRGPAKPEPRPV